MSGSIPSPVKSVLVILAGFIATFGFNGVCTEVMRLTVPELALKGSLSDTIDPLILALVIYFGAGVVGSFAVGHFAPGHAWTHVWIWGALAIAMDVAYTVVGWEAFPVWFHVLAVGSVPPQVWLGGALGISR